MIHAIRKSYGRDVLKYTRDFRVHEDQENLKSRATIWEEIISRKVWSSRKRLRTRKKFLSRS